jgi:Ribosomal Proteins L2, C-terminal domain
MVAAEGMRAGDVVESYRAGIPKDLLASMGGVVDPGVLAARTAWRGNCLPLHMIPIGTVVYNVGSMTGKGAVFCRSAGTHAVVVSKDENTSKRGQSFVNVRLQSGEIRKVSRDACATIGVASNPNYQHTQLGKAGRKRWLNIRPTVRGLAMNAGRTFWAYLILRVTLLIMLQRIIPTVVAEGNLRGMSILSVHGACLWVQRDAFYCFWITNVICRPKEDIKPVTSGNPISGLWHHGWEIKENEKSSRQFDNESRHL